MSGQMDLHMMASSKKDIEKDKESGNLARKEETNTQDHTRKIRNQGKGSIHGQMGVFTMDSFYWTLSN